MIAVAIILPLYLGVVLLHHRAVKRRAPHSASAVPNPNGER